MTRAMCSRTSKRKQTKLSQDIISENCNENSPRITSQSKAVSKEENYRKQVKTCSRVLTSKENIVLGSNHQNSISFHNNECSLRKSERHRKSSFNNVDYVYDVPKDKIKSDISAKRNVLSDRTNSPSTCGTKTNTHSESTLQTTLNKCNNSTKLINTCQFNESCKGKDNSKPHIPIYKTVDPSDIEDTTCNLPLEKKEAVYEFDEVDENEEPVKKRKKKKRVNIRKPKIGPKALTINNIKYNSTESLVSLPEKPVRQKKTKSKRVAPCLKSYSSVNNLNDNEDTCYSVQSFMSHPPSLLLCNKRELKNKHELSVLQETQSENCQTPVHESRNRLSNVENLPEILVDNHLNSNPINIYTVSPNDSRVSQNNSANLQHRCYPSKKSYCEYNTHGISQCGSVNNSFPNHSTHYSANISSGSSHDFLSSTPCKRTSLVARHNSVFSDSYDRDIPIGLRPSTGFIKDASENIVIDDDKYFGFDEPEELEEPLVSPIKNINLQTPRILPRCRHELPLNNEIENPKPDVKEVIGKLKASIPKAQTKETSEVFNSDSSSSDHSIPSSPISKEVETTLSFIKPPRRSYERQRRVRYYSEHEEEEEEEEKREEYDSQQRDKNYGERENVLKPAKKCYQKKNVSKVFKAPHVPVAKQRILKEEEELERFAAQMNAQFQEIEKCNLVVE